MRWWLFGLVVLCSIISTNTAAQNVIMCWNVENYFDTYDNPNTADDEFTPFGEKHWGRQRFINKRNNISKTIISVKDEYGAYPFIVGMVEVENSYVLKELVSDTPLSKLGYNYIHRESVDPRGIECALLYREGDFSPILVKNVGVEKVYENKPIRDILYVKGVYYSKDVTIEGDTIHVLVNHWSSKLGGESVSEPNRMASALRVVEVVDSILTVAHDANVVVMGDFNDTPDSRPVSVLGYSKGGLKVLSESLFREKKGTIKYKGEWELIDHFAVSPNMYNWVMSIYSPDFLLEEDKQYLGVKPARTYNGPKYLGGVSDHLPIILSE